MLSLKVWIHLLITGTKKQWCRSRVSPGNSEKSLGHKSLPVGSLCGHALASNICMISVPLDYMYYEATMS